LGDSIANRIGVCAEPEIFSKEISDQDEVLILASDGVFEFVPNQMVLDLCMKHKNNPIHACESVVDASFEKWLTYEDRTDDITVIVIFIDHEAEDTDD
jgi:cGMP-dependent protein kinase